MSVTGTATLTRPKPQRNCTRVPAFTDTWPSVIALTDEDRAPDASAQMAGVPRGGAVLIRRRDQDRALCDATALAADAAAQGILVSVSLSTPPRSLPAAGLHIPESALQHWRRTDLARLCPMFVTASAHGWAGIHKAAALGVDAVLLSAVFPTDSHPTRAALGLFRFAALVRDAPMPVYALGGMTCQRGRRTGALGAIGVAGIGGFARPGLAR